MFFSSGVYLYFCILMYEQFEIGCGAILNKIYYYYKFLLKWTATYINYSSPFLIPSIKVQCPGTGSDYQGNPGFFNSKVNCCYGYHGGVTTRELCVVEVFVLCLSYSCCCCVFPTARLGQMHLVCQPLVDSQVNRLSTYCLVSVLFSSRLNYG